MVYKEDVKWMNELIPTYRIQGISCHISKHKSTLPDIKLRPVERLANLSNSITSMIHHTASFSASLANKFLTLSTPLISSTF